MWWQVANQAQEASAPYQAAEQEAALSASPHSVTPAVISWDSFKSLAKPGDTLRLFGDSTVPSGDANNGQAISFGVVTLAASGMPLVTSADVAEWEADMSSAAQQTGDDTESAGTSNLPAWNTAGISNSADGNDSMQWEERMEAAGSQAEKLLVLAEVGHRLLIARKEGKPAAPFLH